MVSTSKLIREPLQPTGCLDKYDYFEVTPCIGRQYTNLSLRDMLNAPNSDEMIREFAIIVSTRGVVFLRDQELTLEEQKTLVKKMGWLTGREKDAGLHIHPSVRAKTDTIVHEEAQNDPEAFLVSNRLWKVFFNAPNFKNVEEAKLAKKNRNGAMQWHTEYIVFIFILANISLMFEQVPADYSFLRMHIHPPSGGDTLWASGVEMYSRISTKMQKYLQGLTLTADQTDNLLSSAKKGGFELWTEPRGHPLNSGTDFTPTHPVVRTNPVTGLNSIYGVGLHVKKINDVTKAESDYLMKMFLDTVTQNHDLQVRFRWLPKSCAIWDNRSVTLN